MPRIGRCEWCNEAKVDLSRHPKQRFCSKHCFGKWRWKNHPETMKGFGTGSNPSNIGKSSRGEDSPLWKGDNITRKSAMSRTRSLYPNPEPCHRCGIEPDKTRIVRHHRDRNRLNNDRNNIEFLCVKCHSREHFH